MTIQQIDDAIQKLRGLVARGQQVGAPYKEQGAAVAKCMPVIEELRKLIDNDWQPIETAPTDGTRIIATSKGCEVQCHYFHQTAKQWWIEYADGPGWQPTHWKPMPKFIPQTTAPCSLLDALFEESPQEAKQ